MIIKRVSNGYIVKDEEGSVVVEIVDTYDKDGEVNAFVNLLYYINERIGPSTSRYSKERVSISIVPGDKYEDAHLDDEPTS